MIPKEICLTKVDTRRNDSRRSRPLLAQVGEIAVQCHSRSHGHIEECASSTTLIVDAQHTPIPSESEHTRT